MGRTILAVLFAALLFGSLTGPVWAQEEPAPEEKKPAPDGLKPAPSEDQPAPAGETPRAKAAKPVAGEKVEIRLRPGVVLSGVVRGVRIETMRGGRYFPISDSEARGAGIRVYYAYGLNGFIFVPYDTISKIKFMGALSEEEGLKIAQRVEAPKSRPYAPSGNDCRRILRLQNVSMTGEHSRALGSTPEHSTRPRKSLTGKAKLRKSSGSASPADTGKATSSASRSAWSHGSGASSRTSSAGNGRTGRPLTTAGEYDAETLAWQEYEYARATLYPCGDERRGEDPAYQELSQPQRPVAKAQVVHGVGVQVGESDRLAVCRQSQPEHDEDQARRKDRSGWMHRGLLLIRAAWRARV